MKTDQCENEKIRIPGSIQPHGLLVAYDNLSKQLSYASENLSKEILQRLQVLDLKKLETISKKYKLYSVEGLSVFEFDNFRPDPEAQFQTQSILEMVTSLSASKNLDHLFARTAVVIRELTSFDRVMVYRFDPAWNGRVISESKSPELDSFLGLHFPASDIPAQARELYLTNWLRLIPDVHYVPVPIVALMGGSAFDLSQSRFRSVSPIHIQYLKNMEVGASMSVSIIEDGRLWGLIACHHRAPKLLSQNLLDDCETIGRFISLQIAVNEKSELVAYRQIKRTFIEKLETTVLGESKSVAEVFSGRSSYENDLLELVSAAGSAYVKGTEVYSVGKSPSARHILKIAGVLNANASPSPHYHTEQLGKVFSELSDLSSVCPGLLSIKIPDVVPSYLFWFRPEQKENVRWAGDPHQKNSFPLTPRQSFNEWSEVVSGKARVWEKYEIEVANDFLQSIIKSNLLQQIKLEEVARHEAEESNRELDSFANIVAHDLKEPLRGIRHFATFLKEDEAEKLSSESRENLDHISSLASRMHSILDALYEYSRLGMTQLGWTEVDLNADLIDLIGSLKHLIRQKNASVEVLSRIPILLCDRVRVMEVFQNLIANALKYNTSQFPRVEISYQDRQGIAEISVTDNGIGIDVKQLSQAFESFTRLPGAEKFGPGTGMGLSIVKRVIEKHGGKIRVESSKGVGTRFCFTLAPVGELE